MNRFKFVSKNKIDELPKTMGVYSFYEKNMMLYIGKAINIKDRVKNHFHQPSYRDNLFIDKVAKIGYLETGSEIEALILEANLIKKYQPKFNVIWKDDKNYFYVAITKSEKPVISITHQKNESSEYVGPFVEGTALKKTLRFLRRAFPFYNTARHPKNKCTYCHLGLCPGPEPDLKEYRKNIKKLVLILKGKRGAVLNSLKKEMKQFSKEREFEKAGKIRDRIYNLQQVMAHTHVISSTNLVSTLCVKHAIAYFTHSLSGLNSLLDINKISRIECYDVSNIQGKQATGSMVVFIDGKPDKNQYRKFKIRLPEKPNDIAMLKEVLQRRFAHPKWNYPEVILIDGGKAQLNATIETKNLKNYFKNSKIKNLKIISIAKGRQELFIEGRDKPIPLKNLPQEVYNLIKHLDDEAHRFAIAYHKKLRRKNLLQ